METDLAFLYHIPARAEPIIQWWDNMQIRQGRRGGGDGLNTITRSFVKQFESAE